MQEERSGRSGNTGLGNANDYAFVEDHGVVVDETETVELEGWARRGGASMPDDVDRSRSLMLDRVAPAHQNT